MSRRLRAAPGGCSAARNSARQQPLGLFRLRGRHAGVLHWLREYAGKSKVEVHA